MTVGLNIATPQLCIRVMALTRGSASLADCFLTIARRTGFGMATSRVRSTSSAVGIGSICSAGVKYIVPLIRTWHGSSWRDIHPPRQPELPDHSERRIASATSRERVYQALDQPMTIREIAVKAGLTCTQAQDAIWGLVKRGLIEAQAHRRMRKAVYQRTWGR